MTTSLRSRPRDTETRSWWTSVLPSPRPSSPTSSTASTTPTSTSPQPHKRLHNQDQRKDYDDEHACKRHPESVCRDIAQIRPARGGSRLPLHSRLDGDHLPVLRLPEVVRV